MDGAQAIIKCLEKQGVTTLFGYPGVAICPFFNRLRDSELITPVLVRQEQNAAHAASGYARFKGKPGVCVATSGPGATNLITGIATAFADSIPIICITGQVRSDLIGSDVFQEADITGACESFVKFSYLVKNAEDIPRIFAEAFYIAESGRPGPVLIDVPIDIQDTQLRHFNYPDVVSLRTYKPTVKGHMVQIRRVLEKIAIAKRPLICAGGGVNQGRACNELKEFAERFGIPIVFTMMGKGVVETNHKLCFGMVGNNGHPYANRAMKEADLLLMIGARVADRAINQPDMLIDEKELIHIDVDPAEIGKNVGPTIPLVGDVATILRELLFESMKYIWLSEAEKPDSLPVKENNEEDIKRIYESHRLWIETLRRYKHTMKRIRKLNPEFVDPADFIKELTAQMSDTAVYVADVGQNQIWSCNYAQVKSGKFMTSGGMGTMGYSIPAAMGVAAASSDTQVVALCGDGSFQMSFMELATLIQHKINVKIIVFNNGCLGMVREFQHFVYDDALAMVDLSGSPDLSFIAKAYGIPFRRVADMSSYKDIITDFLDLSKTALMEVLIDPKDIVR